jgi:hypothetical protein
MPEGLDLIEPGKVVDLVVLSDDYFDPKRLTTRSRS